MRFILITLFFCSSALVQGACPSLTDEQKAAIPFAVESCTLTNPGRIENMYKIETPHGLYSFKVLNRGPLINRRTANWTAQAVKAGVGAPATVLNPELGLLINEWEEAAPFPPDQDTLEPVAEMIRTFHRYAKSIQDSDVQRFSPGDQALEFLAPNLHMSGSEGPFAARLWELGALNTQIETALRDVDQPQIIHGDFGYRNIIFTSNGEPILIDWSDVRQGDVMDDLCYYAYSMSLTPEDAVRFLALYFGREPTPVEQAQYYMKTIQFFLWHMAKFVQPLKKNHNIRLEEDDLKAAPPQKLSDFRRERRLEGYLYKNNPEELKKMIQMALYEIDVLRNDPLFAKHMDILQAAKKKIS